MNTPIPTKLALTMATRARRMHNYLWHEVRDNWLTYPKELQTELRKAGWQPPRPALDERGRPFLTNDSGEDYLYMHRITIRYANKILAQVGDLTYPRIEGWLDIPAPDDLNFPVPAPWFDPGEFPAITQFTTRAKSDMVFQKYLKFWSNTFTNPGFLKGISLGMFGALIHSTVHDTVKRRWSAVPGGRRPEPGPTIATIPVEWDDPRYDYLGDFYSMQLNPVYWKFYGWVDDRIEDWKVVHGVFGSDFWRGQWVGKMPNGVGEGTPSELHERLEDPVISTQHVAELEQLLLAIGRSLASADSP